MAEVAVLKKWGDTFYFASDEGDKFYEVAPAPTKDSDLDHLRPLGVVKDQEGIERMHRLSYARRWLNMAANDPSAPGEVEFYTV